MADQQRTVELAMRVNDLSTAPFKQITSAVQGLTASLVQQTAAAKTTTISTGELRDTEKQLLQASVALSTTQGLIDQYTKQAAALVVAKAALGEAVDAQQKFTDSLNTADPVTARVQKTIDSYQKSVDKAAKSLDTQQARLDATSTKLQTAGLDTNNLTAASEELMGVALQVGAGLNEVNGALANYSRYARENREATLAAAAAAKERQAVENAVAASAALAAKEEAQAAVIAQQQSDLVLKARRAFGAYVGQQQADQAAAAAKTAAAEATAADKEAAALAKVAKAEAETAAAAKERAAQQTMANYQASRSTTLGQAPQLSAAAAAKAASPSQQTGLLGLKPYELTNLSYQLNDVFTQLASGTGILQTAAQQGGQVFQIFDKNIFALIPKLPIIAVGIGAVGTAIAAMVQAMDIRQSTKDFQSALDATTSGVNYNAAALTGLRQNIRNLGVSWDDAGTIIKTSIASSLNPDRIVQFAEAAKDLAQLTGEKVPAAMTTLTNAFTHGWAAVQAFNEQAHFLSDAQAQNVKDMFDAGNQAQANTTAFNVYSSTIKKAADEGLGSWAAASRDAGIAWRDLLTALGDLTIIKALEGAWRGVAAATDIAARAFHNYIAGATTVTEISSQLTVESARLTRLKAPGPDSRENTSDAAIAAQQAVVDNLKAKLATAQATSNPDGSPMTLADQQQAIHDREAIQDTNDKIDAEKGLSDAQTKRLAIQAALADSESKYGSISKETQATIIATVGANQDRIVAERNYKESLDKTNESIKDGANWNQINAAGIQARTVAARSGIASETALNEAEVKGRAAARDAIAKQGEAYLATAEAAKRLAEFGKNAPAIEAAGAAAYQKAVDAGITDTKTLIKARQDAEDAEKSRLQQAATAANKAQSQQNKVDNQDRSLQNELASLEKSAGGKGLTTLQSQLDDVNNKFGTLQRNITKFQQAGGTSIGGQSISQFQDTATQAQTKAQQLTTISFQEADINRIQSERNSLVTTYNQLVAIGAITQNDANAKIQQAYKDTAPEIQAAADQLQKMADAAKNAGNISGSQFDLLNAKIQQFRTQTTYVNPLVQKLDQNLDNAFSSGITNAIEGVGTAIGNLATGAGNFGDVMKSVGVGVLNIFASILKTIGETIVQFEVMNALKGSGAGSSILGFLGIGAAGAAGAGGAAAAGAAGAGASAEGIAVLALHTGGKVGTGPRYAGRTAPLSIFANAPRYHDGYQGVGLAPDERAAILKTGEDVLSTTDPMNSSNRGKYGGGASSIRNVVVFGDNDVAAATAGRAGEKVFLTHAKNNVGTLRQMLK